VEELARAKGPGRISAIANSDRSRFTCAEPAACLCWWRFADACRPSGPRSVSLCRRLVRARGTSLSRAGRYRRRSGPPSSERLPRPARAAPGRQPARPLPATASRQRRTTSWPRAIDFEGDGMAHVSSRIINTTRGETERGITGIVRRNDKRSGKAGREREGGRRERDCSLSRTSGGKASGSACNFYLAAKIVLRWFLVDHGQHRLALG